MAANASPAEVAVAVAVPTERRSGGGVRRPRSALHQASGQIT